MLKMLLGFLLAVSMLMPSLGCQTMDELKTGLRMTFGIGADAEPTPSPFDIKRAEEEARMEPEVEPADELIWLSEVDPTEAPEDCETCRERQGVHGVTKLKVGIPKDRLSPEYFPDSLDEIMEYHSEWSYLQKSTMEDGNYTYALYPAWEDYSYLSDWYYESMYMLPYNTYDYDSETAIGWYPMDPITDDTYGFMTNKECMETYGEDFLLECIRLARLYIYGNYSKDARSLEACQTIIKSWSAATGVMTGLDIAAKNAYASSREGNFIAYAEFATDTSFVYQDAAGNIRVRGNMIQEYEQMSEALHAEGLDIGDYGVQAKEVVLSLVEGELLALADISIEPTHIVRTDDSDRYAFEDELKYTPKA